MTRRLASLALGLVLLAATAVPALAQTLDVRLINNSGYQVYSIRSTFTHDGSWGPDILGRGVLDPGEHIDVAYAARTNCYVDLWVIWTDGAESQSTHDVCAVATIYIQ